jgi:[LSU ribosomal protein L11P]-lysine N-methyltransferase (EC 2.1.1.-)
VNWSEIRIHTTHEAIEPIANILYEAGAGGLVIEDSLELKKEREPVYGEIFELDPKDFPEEGVVIKAYFPSGRFLKEIIEDIEQSIIALPSFGIHIGPYRMDCREIEEKQWAEAWKTYYHPVKVSRRFTIVPTWETYHPKDREEKIIELDPGMAFGTGTHPTTAMCLKALEKVVRPGSIVFDVGTGSGILSIAAALLGARKVLATDIDGVAVDSAKRNCELNRVQRIVEIKQNHLLDGIGERADCIVANLLAEIIIPFAPSAANHLRSGGHFIASGIIRNKQEEVERALRQAGFTVQDLMESGDWLTFVAGKGS